MVFWHFSPRGPLQGLGVLGSPRRATDIPPYRALQGHITVLQVWGEQSPGLVCRASGLPATNYQRLGLAWLAWLGFGWLLGFRLDLGLISAGFGFWLSFTMILLGSGLTSIAFRLDLA